MPNRYEAKQKFFKLANGHRTRVCFRGDLRVKILCKSPSKDKPQHLELYPNYMIAEFKIDVESRKPKAYSFEEGNVALKFDSTCIFAGEEHSNQLSTKELGMLSKSVIQIHFLETFKDNEYSITSGTGVLIQLNNQPFVLTCLHTFIPSKEQLESLIVITNSETDTKNAFEQCLREKKRQDKFETLQSFLEKNLHDQVYWVVSLDQGFLIHRKKWLELIQSNKMWQSIVDPLSGMKPSPAFDISILEVSMESAHSLINSNKEFYDLKRVMENMDIGNEQNRPIYLFGFNEATGMVNFSSEEYKQTVIMDDDKDQPKIEAPINKFINDGKSLSAGECIIVKDGFIIYKATTNEGSSGGPLFDSQGGLLGISFGNFQDVETPELVKDSEFLEGFDIGYPNEKIVPGSRNYNLGVAISHDGLWQYLASFGKYKAGDSEIKEGDLGKITQNQEADLGEYGTVKNKILDSSNNPRSPQRKSKQDEHHDKRKTDSLLGKRHSKESQEKEMKEKSPLEEGDGEDDQRLEPDIEKKLHISTDEKKS